MPTGWVDSKLMTHRQLWQSLWEARHSGAGLASQHCSGYSEFQNLDYVRSEVLCGRCGGGIYRKTLLRDEDTKAGTEADAGIVGLCP